MRVVEKIRAWSHLNVTANNRMTFEVTKERHLTRKGNCIMAVNASKGARDLNDEFRQLVRRNDAEITVIIEAGSYREIVKGRGDTRLTLSHATDLVGRKSSYVCSRTLMVHSDKVAIDFSRNLVRMLQRPSQKVIVTCIVEV